MVNDKGKLFGVINPIDILAVLGVVAIGAFLAWFLIGGRQPEFDRYIYFTVEVLGVDADLAQFDNIQIGDEVRDTIFGVEIGTIANVERDYHTQWVFDRVNEQMVQTTIPGYEKLYITIRSLGFDNGRSLEIMSPGYEMRVGRRVDFRGRGYQGHGFVVYLSEVMR